MSTQFSEQSKKAIETILSRYPNKQAALLPLLWVAQEQFGWVSSEVIELVARTLELSTAHVYGVVTFYTMYHQKPPGRYHIQVCQTLSCAMSGCDRLIDRLKEKLEIQAGETTQDKQFSLETVECLASCGTAPAMRINEKYYENLTIEKVDQLLESLGRHPRESGDPEEPTRFPLPRE